MYVYISQNNLVSAYLLRKETCHLQYPVLCHLRWKLLWEMISKQKVLLQVFTMPLFLFQPWPFPSTRPSLRYSAPYLSGTIAHEPCGFCYGGALHQSNGEYSFHCALMDHNLEMVRVINNLLSLLLNETCILLTSESTKINCVWWKPLSWSLYLQDANKTSPAS